MNVTTQLATFVSLGAVGTSAHYFTLLLLVTRTSVKPIAASSVGFVIGALVNYGLNYHITFRSNKPHKEAMARFFIVALTGLVLNSLIMALGTEILRQHYLPVQIVATGVVLVWNFMGNRSWTFGA